MKSLVLAGLALLASSVVGAQGPDNGGTTIPFGLIIAEQARASFTLTGAGARAAGMGGAFTAVADDATAASFNPAGLAQMLEPEASLVWTYQQIEDSYTGFHTLLEAPQQRLSDSTVDFDRSSLNFASITYPFRLGGKRWAVQGSIHRAVDFEYEGDQDLVGYVQLTGEPVSRILQWSRQSGEIGLLSASVAVELTQRTLIGITYNRWEGDWGFETYNARQSLIDPARFGELSYMQSSTLKGSNFDLGLLLRYPRFNLGIRYRTEFDADYTISAQGSEDFETLDGLRTTLSWPRSLNVGVALKLSDRWLVAADWGRTRWSDFNFYVDETFSEHNFFDLLPPEFTQTEDTDDWRIGTEVLFFAGQTVIPVRAGWFREPHPSSDLFTGERLITEGFSVGAGFKTGALAFDLAVRYSDPKALVSRFYMPRDFSRPEDVLPNAAGNLSRRQLDVFASVIVQFPRGSGQGNLLHEIFVGPVSKSAEGDSTEP